MTHQLFQTTTRALCICVAGMAGGPAVALDTNGAQERLADFLASDADFIVLELNEDYPGLCHIDQIESGCDPVLDSVLIGQHGRFASEVYSPEGPEWGFDKVQAVLINDVRYYRVVRQSGTTIGISLRDELQDEVDEYEAVFADTPWSPYPVGLCERESSRTPVFCAYNDADYGHPSTVADLAVFLSDVAPNHPSPMTVYQLNHPPTLSFEYDDFDELGTIRAMGFGSPLAPHVTIQGDSIQYAIEGFISRSYREDEVLTSTPHTISIRSETIDIDLTDLRSIPESRRIELRNSAQHYLRAPISEETAKALSDPSVSLRVRFRMKELDKDFEARTTEYYGFPAAYEVVQAIRPYLQ